MRLICPNCGAQYEVDDGLVPDSGRDVQCSNCGHAWFQQAAHKDQALADELETDLPGGQQAVATGVGSSATANHVPYGEGEPDDEVIDDDPPPAVSPPSPARPAMDESIRGILAEEAEREANARREEVGSVETQGDLGLESEASKPTGLRERMARLRGQDVDDRADSAAAAVAAATAAGSRRDLLPDIEEINSSLRSADERDEDAAREIRDLTERKSGFRLGFGLVILAAVIAVLVYAFADKIGHAVPTLEPTLTAYVDWADRMRAWLDDTAQGWLKRLTAMIHTVNDSDAQG